MFAIAELYTNAVDKRMKQWHAIPPYFGTLELIQSKI